MDVYPRHVSVGCVPRCSGWALCNFWLWHLVGVCFVGFSLRLPSTPIGYTFAGYLFGLRWFFWNRRWMCRFSYNLTFVFVVFLRSSCNALIFGKVLGYFFDGATFYMNVGKIIGWRRFGYFGLIVLPSTALLFLYWFLRLNEFWFKFGFIPSPSLLRQNSTLCIAICVLSISFCLSGKLRLMVLLVFEWVWVVVWFHSGGRLRFRWFNLLIWWFGKCTIELVVRGSNGWNVVIYWIADSWMLRRSSPCASSCIGYGFFELGH